MDAENLRKLIAHTKNRIKYFEEYMQGYGNSDEFDNELYPCVMRGARRPSYKSESESVCRKFLQILNKRLAFFSQKLEEIKNEKAN